MKNINYKKLIIRNSFFIFSCFFLFWMYQTGIFVDSESYIDRVKGSDFSNEKLVFKTDFTSNVLNIPDSGWSKWSLNAHDEDLVSYSSYSVIIRAGKAYQYGAVFEFKDYKPNSVYRIKAQIFQKRGSGAIGVYLDNNILITAKVLFPTEEGKGHDEYQLDFLVPKMNKMPVKVIIYHNDYKAMNTEIWIKSFEIYSLF